MEAGTFVEFTTPRNCPECDKAVGGLRAAAVTPTGQVLGTLSPCGHRVPLEPKR